MANHRLARMFAPALCALAIAGCIVVPIPPMGVGMIDRVTIDSIKPGMARFDVLLLVGDPHERVYNDRYFIYRWDEAHAAVLIGGYTVGYAIPIEDRNALAIEFTSDHKVAKVQRFNRWKFEEGLPLEGDLDSFTGAIRKTTGVTTAAGPEPGTDAAAPLDLAAPGAALVPLFEGPALWHPDWRSVPSERRPPAQGVAGRLVVSGDGVAFYERVGTSGVEVPYRIGRDEIVRVDCAPPRVVIQRVRGGSESFTVLRGEGAAGDGGVTDVGLTEQVCGLIRNQLTRRAA
jgi:outer membrane protein assembly factor BamE (lipoprotein component of BamABCDE complex)